MDFYANEGKAVTIQVGERTFARHAIKTRFVEIGDDYLELMRTYVLPVYQEGDILSMSEKVIALCQGRVVYEKDVQPGFLAKFLSKFVHQTSAGPGAGNVFKMQFAININGPLKVLWAAICAGVGKLFGKKGIFYDMVGPEVTGLDGFYGHDIEEYAHMGIRIPDQPDKVCDEIYEKTGIRGMIVDANAISVEVLGHASVIQESDETLVGMILDNPAGQVRQFTPFILIREITGQEAPVLQSEAATAPRDDEAQEV